MTTSVKITYDKSTGTLTVVGSTKTWNATSGIPNKHKPIADGLYTVPKNALMAGKTGEGVPYDPKYNKSPYRFQDKKGFSWFLWLGKGELGIHPDGNVPGTLGCIGITDDDTKPLFNELKKLKDQAYKVQVKGSNVKPT